MWGETPHTHIVHGSARRSLSAQRGMRRANKGMLSLQAAFCMWGETPHTPHVFARPPALFAAASGNGIPKDAPLRQAVALPPFWPCQLAPLCRKTRRPRRRQTLALFGITWHPLHERRVAFIGGGVGWVGDPTPPTSPRLPCGGVLHVGGIAPHTPHSFCPPTRHLCTSAAFAWRCFGARLRVEFLGCGFWQGGAEGLAFVGCGGVGRGVGGRGFLAGEEAVWSKKGFFCILIRLMETMPPMKVAPLPAGRDALPSGCGLREFGDVGSTHEEAARLLAECSEKERAGLSPTWITARSQSAGRGRRGRGWESPEGNLYASLLFRPQASAAEAPQLSLVAALALWDVARALVPLERGEVALKWPNDVLVDGAKLAGILLETMPSPSGSSSDEAGWVAVGFGVNLLHCPSDTPYPAASLRALGVSVSARRMLALLAWRMRARLQAWACGRGFAAVRSAWMRRAYGLGSLVRAGLGPGGGTVTGVFLGLDSSGGLRLALPEGGECSIAAGDVRFLRGASPPTPPSSRLASAFDLGGETPPSPPLLLPTHPPFSAAASGNGVPKDAPSSQAVSAHPSGQSRAAPEESKDAPPAQAVSASHVGGIAPHTPHVFCPPTHPFCSASRHGFMPKGTPHPWGAVGGGGGGSALHDAPVSREAVGSEWGGSAFHDAADSRGAVGGDWGGGVSNATAFSLQKTN